MAEQIYSRWLRLFNRTAFRNTGNLTMKKSNAEVAAEPDPCDFIDSPCPDLDVLRSIFGVEPDSVYDV